MFWNFTVSVLHLLQLCTRARILRAEDVLYSQWVQEILFKLFELIESNIDNIVNNDA